MRYILFKDLFFPECPDLNTTKSYTFLPIKLFFLSTMWYNCQQRKLSKSRSVEVSYATHYMIQTVLGLLLDTVFSNNFFFSHFLFSIFLLLPYLTLPITRQNQGLLSQRMVLSPEMRSVLNSLLLSIAGSSKYSP